MLSLASPFKATSALIHYFCMNAFYWVCKEGNTKKVLLIFIADLPSVCRRHEMRAQGQAWSWTWLSFIEVEPFHICRYLSAEVMAEKNFKNSVPK